MDLSSMIRDRQDLSSFLFHMTKGGENQALNNLTDILKNRRIKAVNPFGLAVSRIRRSNLDNKEQLLKSQYCICFTETPLHHIKHLCFNTNAGKKNYENFGIGIPKKLGRESGINPVWYIDNTPYHDFLNNPIGELVKSSLDSHFIGSPISKITPFMELMGTGVSNGKKYMKEFWYEREWRLNKETFILPGKFIVIVPERFFDRITEDILSIDVVVKALLIDSEWSLEEMITLARPVCNLERPAKDHNRYSNRSLFESRDINPFINDI